MKDKYLISITIPTYNRLDSIKNIFSFLIKDKLFNKFEICISDNNSEDQTYNYLCKLKEKYANIVINKNESNIGYEGNLRKAIDISNGEYVWTLSDDDILSEYAIRNVYQTVKENNGISLFFLNYNIVNEDTNTIINSRCEINENGIYNKNDFIEKVRLANSFGGSNIFKRKDLLNINLDDYANNLYCHVFWCFALLEKSRIYIISSIIINMRGLSFESSRLEKKNDPLSSFDYYLNAHFQLCKSLLVIKNSDYNKSCYNKIYNQLIYESLWQVTVFKIRNLNCSLKVKYYIFKNLKFYFRSSYFFWLLIFPLIFSNNKFIKLLYLLQRKIRKK